MEVWRKGRGVASFSGQVVEDMRLGGNEIHVLVLGDIVNSIELLKKEEFDLILSRWYRDVDSQELVQLGISVSKWTKTRVRGLFRA